MKIRGFSLIEIIIAIALVAIFIPAIGWTLAFSLKSASQGENFSKATALGQQYMEAMYFLKSQNNPSWDWTTNPPNTTTSQYYQPVSSGGTWTLGSLINETNLQKTGIFTPKVEIQNHPTIGSSFARKIIVTASWLENNQNQEIKLTSYVTAH